MIYTVTFNPSLDYIVTVDDFRTGLTNRTRTEEMLPGGKGTNVSIVLKNLGFDSTALGFAAGFTGDEICRMLETTGIVTDFIRVNEGFSRINLKLTSIDGTEINGQGPHISEEKVAELFVKLDALKEGDTLVLAGSIPSSMPSSIYSTIMERLKDRGILFVVDATKQLLMNVLVYHPFLIKPNKQELGELFGVTIQTKDDVIPYAQKMQQMGARNVLISMGGEGAVLVAEDGTVLKAEAPQGIVRNSVGAGDSMVAGFMAGWFESGNYEGAFRMGIATGSASAFSDRLATRPEVEDVMRKVVIHS